jgi:carboxymethylenebutenolidase
LSSRAGGIDSPSERAGSSLAELRGKGRATRRCRSQYSAARQLSSVVPGNAFAGRGRLFSLPPAAPEGASPGLARTVSRCREDRLPLSDGARKPTHTGLDHTRGARMERKKASDFPPELLDLLDRYVHGGISRRHFLEGAQKFAVGGVTAAALFHMLRPNYAWAIQVQPDDKRLQSRRETVASPAGNGRITGYLVRPATTAKLPLVVVIHENRGLNPYIEDVARRLALADFIAFAPDALTSLGGYPGDDEKAADLFAELDRGKMTTDFLAAALWLKSRPDGTGRLGAVGFCFGGGVVNELAVRMGPDLAAAVPFYGVQPGAADVARIKAPINAQYAELDTRITSGWPAFDAALTAAHIVHEGHIYKGAYHGFHNDTTPRYDEAAAKEAWQRTLDWFNKYLRA